MVKRKNMIMERSYEVSVFFADDIEYLASGTVKKIKELVNEVITDSGDVSCRKDNLRVVCGNEMVLDFTGKSEAVIYETWEFGYIHPDRDIKYCGYDIEKHTDEFMDMINKNRTNPAYEAMDCPEVKRIEVVT